MAHGEVREKRVGVVQSTSSIQWVTVDPREEVQFAFLLGLLTLSEVPLTPFEAAMFHLQTRLTEKLRQCPNPMYPAPHFFVTKKGQKFCSAVCADVARRHRRNAFLSFARRKTRSLDATQSGFQVSVGPLFIKSH